MNTEQLYQKDKFELYCDHGYWLYYNENGNDGNGQIVETYIYPWDVLLAPRTEDEFWEHLCSVCKTHLRDRNDSDFDDYMSALLENDKNSYSHRNEANANTMCWLIDWAKNHI